jgi:hypothetical protein
MQANAQKQENTTVRLHGNHSNSNNLATSASGNHGRELLLARTEDGDIYQTEARTEKNQRPSLRST